MPSYGESSDTHRNNINPCLSFSSQSTVNYCINSQYLRMYSGAHVYTHMHTHARTHAYIIIYLFITLFIYHIHLKEEYYDDPIWKFCSCSFPNNAALDLELMNRQPAYDLGESL